MAAPLAQPETVARAILEKAPATPPAAGSSQEAAAKIREDLQQKGPRSALESLRQPKPPEQKKIDSLLDRNIGTERDASGKKVRRAGSDEDKRFKEAQEAEKLGKEFLEKGYDALSTTQKVAIYLKVEQAFSAWPEGKTLLAGMPAADRQACMEGILKDPDFIAKHRASFGEANLKTVEEEALIEAKRKFEEAKRGEEAKKRDIARNNGEKTSVDSQLEQFADRTAVGGTKGAKLQELENLDRDMPVLQADLMAKNDQAAALRDSQKDLEEMKRMALYTRKDPTEFITKLADVRNELRTLQREIETLNKQVARKPFLEKEKVDLEQRKLELAEERSMLDGELKNLSQDRARLQADLAGEQLNRSSQEEDFVDGLKGTFSEATLRYLEDKITAAEEAQRRLFEEEEAKAVDPYEKIALEALRLRYEKEITRGGRKEYVLDKDKIKEDYPKLLDPAQGPKGILRDVLIADLDKRFPPGSPGRAAELAKIEAKLKDPDFVKKMEPKIAERLITRQIQTGKLTEDDVRVIRESDWGAGMINKALENKKGLKDEIEALYGKGAVESGSFWKDLKRMSNGSLLKLLLLMLGTAAFGAVPIGMALKSSASNS